MIKLKSLPEATAWNLPALEGGILKVIAEPPGEWRMSAIQEAADFILSNIDCSKFPHAWQITKRRVARALRDMEFGMALLRGYLGFYCTRGWTHPVILLHRDLIKASYQDTAEVILHEVIHYLRGQKRGISKGLEAAQDLCCYLALGLEPPERGYLAFERYPKLRKVWKLLHSKNPSTLP